MNTSRVIATAILLCFAVTTSFAQRSFFPDSFYAFSSHMPPGAIHLNPSDVHYSSYDGQKIDFGIITHNRWCYIVIKAKPPGDEEYTLSVDNTFLEIYETHFTALVGLPAAAFISTFLILLLQIVKKEPLEFEMIGIRFKGSSGEIVLWVFVYLSIVVSIKLLW